MMAYLCNIRAIVEITFVYCFICLFIHAYPTTKSSVAPYRLNNTFYFGKHDLKLQVSKQTRCERIKVPICENGVGYVDTFLPNIFEDRNQHQAGLSLKQFHLLLDVDCSLYLRTFLCSLYLPICSLPFLNVPIPPCHHLCVRVRNDCSHVLDISGWSWPDELNCQNFPKVGLCVGPFFDSIEDNRIIKTIMDYFPQKSLIPNKKKQDTAKTSVVSPNLNLGINGLQKIKGCGILCVDIIYIICWLKSYSILCFLSTFCTICIFCSDMKRYLYPEKALVWMSGCYMVMSAVYIIECFNKERMALILSENTNSSNNNSSIKLSETTWSLSNTTKIATQWQTSSNISTHVLSDVQVNNGCNFYFVIQNVSMVAGCLWWTMASLASYLFISHSRDFVKAISPLFHLVVWYGSFCFSFMLILGFPHPFENGFCSLLTFLNTFLRLCCLFFFLLFKLKELTQMRSIEQKNITRNWDKTMRLFSETCVFAFLIVVVCQMLELVENDKLGDCTEVNITPKTCFHTDHRQNILKVKYFMIFFPGIASGFCMFLTCKKKVQCLSDDNDNEEIHL